MFPDSSGFLHALSDRKIFPGVGYIGYLTVQVRFFLPEPNEVYYISRAIIYKLYLSLGSFL
ncbi:hypothetical protein AWY96_10315 [Serratia plymuthica]|nr:hypothetical protein AWY96_10315 [Serratia plymuthica]